MLFRGLRRQLAYLPPSGGSGIGGLTTDHAGRMLLLEVDEVKGRVHLCIERHPPDLKTGNPITCWQFWLYDAGGDSLDLVEEVPPVTSDGLFASEEYRRPPREQLTAEELKKIAGAPSLPDSLWPLQVTTQEASQDYKSYA